MGFIRESLKHSTPFLLVLFFLINASEGKRNKVQSPLKNWFFWIWYENKWKNGSQVWFMASRLPHLIYFRNANSNFAWIQLNFFIYYIFLFPCLFNLLYASFSFLSSRSRTCGVKNYIKKMFGTTNRKSFHCLLFFLVEIVLWFDSLSWCFDECIIASVLS